MNRNRMKAKWRPLFGICVKLDNFKNSQRLPLFFDVSSFNVSPRKKNITNSASPTDAVIPPAMAYGYSIGGSSMGASVVNESIVIFPIVLAE